VAKENKQGQRPKATADPYGMTTNKGNGKGRFVRDEKKRGNGKGNRRSFDCGVRKVREHLRSG